MDKLKDSTCWSFGFKVKLAKIVRTRDHCFFDLGTFCLEIF